MKRSVAIICMVLSLLLQCCISGCTEIENNNPISKSEEKLKDLAEYTTDIDSLTTLNFNIFNNIGYGIRHSTSYDEHVTMQPFISLQNYNKHMPIELVKKIDEDHIMVVYKLWRKDLSTSLVYVLFEKKDEDSAIIKTDVNETTEDENREYWETTGEFYFVAKKLSSADFESVKVGDSAKSVLKLDPAIKFDFNFNCVYPLDENYNFKRETIRVLTDGIMVIDFDIPMDGTDVTNAKVISKTFCPYSDSNFPDNVPRLSEVSPEKLVTLKDFSFIEYLD